MHAEFGLVKIASCCPEVAIGNPDKNVEVIKEMISSIDADILLFPELCITGYTCADLFQQEILISRALELTYQLSFDIGKKLVVVGLPILMNGRLYNCAAILSNGKILGLVPKSYIPNYKEFYEKRWFASGKGVSTTIQSNFYNIPFGTDLLFNCGEVVVGVEICEDIWIPIPPSCHQAIAGANILLNLSASNEIVGKSEYRTDLVKNQSARCIAAYAYSSAGPTESTTDLVFGGHCLITENGHILQETKFEKGLESHSVIADIDIQKLDHERHVTSFGDESNIFRYQKFELKKEFKLSDKVDGRPFIPKDIVSVANRCREIFNIQCASLAKRIKQLSSGSMLNIGVSGGLDSTLALLVAVKTCDMIGRDRRTIRGITMPGFGTTTKTRLNADKLMSKLGIMKTTIDIKQMCLQVFNDMGHCPFGIGSAKTDPDEPLTMEELQSGLDKLPPNRQDLTFENVQARVRTLTLMSHGFVIGTGDLSELALGWCTYNGDHMSMYNVNCSIPKTLVKLLVDYAADYEFYQNGYHDKEAAIYVILKDIVATTISPELLPVKNDEVQSTEDALGPYELHDFFLFNFIRHGFSPSKILFLAQHAEFSKEYPLDLIKNTLKTFYVRFFKNQFKRSCVPDGPKVGSISLSPRGDFRMPSDADPSLWLKE